MGIAVAGNGLSEAHAHYLARGGLGFELGDGRLGYRPETIAETYYLAQFLKWAATRRFCEPTLTAASLPIFR